MTNKVEQVIQTSLADFLPKATALTWQEFCGDCPKRQDGCFPCRTAQTMIPIYLSALIAKAAKNN